MRGQILETSDGTAYLCIGEKEGARVGQEYTVYRFIKSPYSYTSPRQRGPAYTRKEVGKIRITELVDEHYANAEIVSGEVYANDAAELNP